MSERLFGGEPPEGPVEEGSLSIGEVINLLRDEFPDVSVSKVRFLESQGLLTLGRSEGGYRQFEPGDVERLRFILRQQRDHFLPLKVIKSKLTLWERGEEPEPGTSEHPTDLLFGGGEPLTRADLLRRSGLTEAELADLTGNGLIGARPDGLFAPAALVVAAEAGRLFSEGLEGRHLRAIRHAVEREADILAQLTAALLRVGNLEARERARAVLAAGGEAMLAVHRALLVEELRRLLER
jgi:DNA-binding transcriptional MerR regulator